jgi:hypothetical protein
MPAASTTVPSHKKLAKQFFDKADRIIRSLDLLEKETRKKISREEISKIRTTMLQVRKFCIPEISQATGHRFMHTDLFLFIFLYRETGALFNKATTNPVQPGSPELLSLKELKNLEMISEDRLALAFIGDAALGLGALINVWRADYPTIPPKGELNKERVELVANAKLANIWDSLAIYDKEILIKPRNENVETRGSSMEAVFGIIYLEGGLPAVEQSLHTLREFYKAKKGNGKIRGE